MLCIKCPANTNTNSVIIVVQRFVMAVAITKDSHAVTAVGLLVVEMAGVNCSRWASR